MTYNELTELLRAKKMTVKELTQAIGMSRQGLQAAMDKGSISLHTIKAVCEAVRISPAYFFDAGTFGTVINAGGHVQSGNNNRMEVESLDRENAMLRQQVEQLRSQLADKEEIIRLMKGKQ